MPIGLDFSTAAAAAHMDFDTIGLAQEPAVTMSKSELAVVVVCVGVVYIVVLKVPG